MKLLKFYSHCNLSPFNFIFMFNIIFIATVFTKNIPSPSSKITIISQTPTDYMPEIREVCRNFLPLYMVEDDRLPELHTSAFYCQRTNNINVFIAASGIVDEAGRCSLSVSRNLGSSAGFNGFLFRFIRLGSCQASSRVCSSLVRSHVHAHGDVLTCNSCG